jgi:DNA-binding GntR family transcriptional regulator
VYTELRKEILTLVLSPRELIVESALAKRFGVSKAPVREALAVLQRDGLVEAFPRKGYLVTALTVNDLKELFELRIALEGTAAAMAASTITEFELDILERLQASPSNSKQPDIAKFLEKNHEFHMTIARASRNARLATLIEKTTEEMGRAIAASYSIGEHAPIIDALRARSPARAYTAMVEHLKGAEFRALHWEMNKSSPGALAFEGARPAH